MLPRRASVAWVLPLGLCAAALAACGSPSSSGSAGSSGSTASASASASARPKPAPARSGLTNQVVDVEGELPAHVRKHQRVTSYSAATDVLEPGTPFCKLKEPSVACPPGVEECTLTPRDVLCGEAAKAPPGKEGWYRVPPNFQGARMGCDFLGDMLCPPPGKADAACTQADMLSLACTSTELPDRGVRIDVPSFEYASADGVCMRVPAFSCQVGKCDKQALPTPSRCDGAAEPASAGSAAASGTPATPGSATPTTSASTTAPKASAPNRK